MMDTDHTVTPPPELVRQLQDLGNLDAIERAYRAGADWELGECVHEILAHPGFEQPELFVELLRAKRRPKPPSLNPEKSAEVALNILDDVSDRLDAPHENGIRRALERLRELEDNNPKLPTPVVTKPPTEIVFEGTRYTRADLVSLEERGGVVIGGVEYLPSKAD